MNRLMLFAVIALIGAVASGCGSCAREEDKPTAPAATSGQATQTGPKVVVVRFRGEEGKVVKEGCCEVCPCPTPAPPVPEEKPAEPKPKPRPSGKSSWRTRTNERLTTLKQGQADLVAAVVQIRDSNVRIEQGVGEIRGQLAKLDERVGKVEERVTALETRPVPAAAPAPKRGFAPMTPITIEVAPATGG